MNPESGKKDIEALLILACPPNADGKKSVAGLARAIGCSVRTLYYITGGKKPTTDIIKRIVNQSEGRVTFEDFIPFLFK